MIPAEKHAKSKKTDRYAKRYLIKTQDGLFVKMEYNK